MRNFRRFISYSLLPIFLSFLFIVGLAVLPANADGHSSEYQPCPNQDAHDFIFLMDKSASLLDTDRDLKRGEALRKISEELAGIPDVRVGLIEFASEAKITRELRPGALSNADIEGAERVNSRGFGLDTNYEAALDLAKGMFKAAQAEEPERCRVLLFFTDGFYDPVGHNEDNYSTSINAGRSTFQPKACGVLSEELHGLDVQTIAVILLDSERGINSVNEGSTKAPLVEISLQALASITGDYDSEIFKETKFTVDVPSNCGGSERNGSIVAVEKVDNLVNDLLREVNKSAKTVYGCPSFAEVNDTIYEAPMPAGSFIQSIDLYAYGGKIRNVQGGGSSLSTDNTGHLTLSAEDLQGLDSGWVLQITVDEGSRLECDAEPVTLVNGFVNASLYSEGVDTGGAISARQNGELIINNGSYSCDGIEDIKLSDIPLPDDSVLQTFSSYDCNNEGVVFPWKDNPDLAEDIDIPSVSGYVIPENKPSDWPNLEFEAIFDPELTVFSIATEPKLSCSGSIEQEEDSDGENYSLKSPMCTVQLDQGVNGKIRVILEITGTQGATQDDWNLIVSESSKSNCTTNNDGNIVNKSSGFCNFSLETKLLPSDEEPFEFDQEATITLQWDETESGSWNDEDGHSYPVVLNRVAEYRDSSDIVACDSLQENFGFGGNDVPEESVKSNVSCKVKAPPFGSLELCTSWELEPDFDSELQMIPQSTSESTDAEWN